MVLQLLLLLGYSLLSRLANHGIIRADTPCRFNAVEELSDSGVFFLEILLDRCEQVLIVFAVKQKK